MARSTTTHPFHGITKAVSEKADKAASHRKLRRVTRQMIEPALETPLPVDRELTNTYAMSKDGKRRFDPVLIPRLMRK